MSITIVDKGRNLSVQLSPSPPSIPLKYTRLPDYIDHTLIPPFLVSEPSVDIYTSSDETEEYFKEALVRASLESKDPIALMFTPSHRATESNEIGTSTTPPTEASSQLHMVVYLNTQKLKLKCCILDFSILPRLASISYLDETGFVRDAPAAASAPVVPTLSRRSSSFAKDTSAKLSPGSLATGNTSVFDKVLSKRKLQSSQNSFIVPSSSASQAQTTALSSQTLSTNEQVTQAINKVILSGLRLRGLSGFLSSSTQQSNEKLAVREIYQMTQKCALFAVRKFNYEFNKDQGQPSSLGSSPIPVQLNDIQDIVENLLSVFIDLDENKVQPPTG